MKGFRRYCSRVSVRRVTHAFQTHLRCASHSEAATGVLLGKERTR
jgi:hypothetical protein